ncbi:MAG: peptide-methionine (R)-S-oxide reductase MsrB [Alphaproteobacteria bacterium]|nr:peptide-methionine (R)-S-oxide reductase MsrB [Alphaproteobacteria bacterium]
MKRREFITATVMAVCALALKPAFGDHEEIKELVMSDDEWKKKLDPQQYNVLRCEGTERAGTSPLLEEHRAGVFKCAGCGLELFKSDTKFDSGTGWPSFFDAIPGHIKTKTDNKLFMTRTEYHCAKCGGHQGHVFDDGPNPTGLRYCNNGVALTFEPEKKS